MAEDSLNDMTELTEEKTRSQAVKQAPAACLWREEAIDEGRRESFVFPDVGRQRKDAGIQGEEEKMMSDSITLNFSKRYAWSTGQKAIKLDESDNGKGRGIYLWTVMTEKGELVHYVGETRSFTDRMHQHALSLLGGEYPIYDPEEAHKGNGIVVWQGWHGKPHEPNGFVGYLAWLQRSAELLVGFSRMLRFRFAPLDADEKLRKYIEASIYQHLKGAGQPPHVASILKVIQCSVRQTAPVRDISICVYHNESIEGLRSEVRPCRRR